MLIPGTVYTLRNLRNEDEDQIMYYMGQRVGAKEFNGAYIFVPMDKLSFCHSLWQQLYNLRVLIQQKDLEKWSVSYNDSMNSNASKYHYTKMKYGVYKIKTTDGKKLTAALGVIFDNNSFEFYSGKVGEVKSYYILAHHIQNMILVKELATITSVFDKILELKSYNTYHVQSVTFHKKYL
jgi:hypothetical protein